jgi:hypothetical protein
MNYRTIEGILIHELAHNSMNRMGLNLYSPERWKIARKIGWQPFYNRATGESSWRFKSKEGDDYYYKYYAYKQGLWVRCDKSGKLLDRNGARTRHLLDARTIGGKEMRRLAEFHPCTDYFLSPLEMFADSLMMYRLKPETRRRLKKQSPHLYEVVKDYDQTEINNTYGKGRYVRSPEGVIVEDTPEAAAAIARFEGQPDQAP